MKRFIINSLLALAATLSAISCTQEPIDPNPYEDGPAFLAFAPNPVYRGGVLTFIGSYLEQVAEVQVPGVDPITQITVEQSGAKSRISVVLPNTTEEVGVITLVTKDGVKLVSSSELTYTEPIVFSDFSPKNAMPGDVITVTGDYMNLVQEVIFSGNAYAVAEAISDQTRKELKVVVPDNAISGRFILGDTDEVANPDNVANKIYSDGELAIGDPTVTSLGEITPKAGEEITISGQYLAMIASATISGVAAEPSVEAGDKHGVKLTLTVPETAADGEIVLTSYAGKEFEAGTVETVVPTDLQITADVFKAGQIATISGNDLDLVTAVALGDAACDFAYDAGNKHVTFTIPATSVDGEAVLTLANGKTVSTEEVTLVKPTITAISPLEITAGESFVIEGTDLDLVTGVKLGSKDETFALGEDGKITVTTAATSVSGKVVIAIENGVKVESTDEIAVKYDSFIVVNEMPDAEHIGAEVTFKGSNFLMIERMYIGDVKITTWVKRTDDEITFVMPYNKIGMYDIKFELCDGSIETCPTKIEVLLEQEIKIIWQGSFNIGNWQGTQDLAWGAFDWSTVKAGTVMTLYATANDPATSWWCISLRHGPDWGALSGVPGQYDLNGTSTKVEVTLSQETLNDLVANNGLVVTGYEGTLTMITLTSEISQEITLWEGELVAEDWANQPYLLSDGGAELSEAGAQVGQTIYIYITPLEDPWKLQIIDGHWDTSVVYGSYCAVGADTEQGKFTEYDLEANGGKIGVVITQSLLDNSYVKQNWGGVFVANGDNVKITKVTLF